VFPYFIFFNKRVAIQVSSSSRIAYATIPMMYLLYVLNDKFKSVRFRLLRNVDNYKLPRRAVCYIVLGI